MDASSTTAFITSAKKRMANSSRSVPVKRLQGRVTLGEYAKGSKSEREAVFLDTGDERYILRRKGGPVFDDEEVKRYVGHVVTCDGFLIGTTLIAERIDQIGEKSKKGPK